MATSHSFAAASTPPYDADLEFLCALPRRVVFGPGSISEVGSELALHGASRALLVTDQNLRSAGLVDKLEGDPRIVATFSEVPPDSSVSCVEAAAATAREAGADAVVSVGGGSVIDTGKMAAVLLTHGGKLADYSGFQMLDAPTVPHIAVPTTAGTGSEVTYVAVIHDPAQHSKLLFADHKLIPASAVLDPALTVGLPQAGTVATGFDALSHCVESVCSMQREPVADILALGAITRIVHALPRCVEVPDDIAARGQQMIAAMLAGVAFSNAQVGLVHALSHPAGAMYRVAHGTLNGIFLPHVMRFNAQEAEVQLRAVAQAIGAAEQTAEGAAAAVEELADRVAQPRRLRDVGVPREGLAALADAALFDGSIVYNPRIVTSAEELMPVLEAAW